MTKTHVTKPILALALSGGAARCIAQLGVLQAFEEEGVPIGAVAGTSGGSLIGALYLDGKMSLPELVSLAVKTGWRDLFKPAIPRTGLVSSDGIHDFIHSHLSARRIGDLPRPFAAVCTDLVSGDKVVLTSGGLAQAVQASCSLPVIFTPTVIGGRTLVDGGVVSQIPVLAAREELGAKLVVAVDVNYKATSSPSLRSLAGIAVHLTQMVARKNAEAELPYADAVIRVDVRGIQLYDIQKHCDLFERGYRAAMDMMPSVKMLL